MLRGWAVRSDTLQRLGTLCLVGILLAALSLPRFGLVWHDHEDPDEDHNFHQLLRLLASSQAYHPIHHPHHHADASHVFLSSANTPHVHGHYVDDSLLVFFCLSRPLTLTLLRVSLRPHRRRVLWARRLAPLPARVPPDPLLLVSSCFATRGRGLSSVV